MNTVSLKNRHQQPTRLGAANPKSTLASRALPSGGAQVFGHPLRLLLFGGQSGKQASRQATQQKKTHSHSLSPRHNCARAFGRHDPEHTAPFDRRPRNSLCPLPRRHGTGTQHQHCPRAACRAVESELALVEAVTNGGNALRSGLWETGKRKVGEERRKLFRARGPRALYPGSFLRAGSGDSPGPIFPPACPCLFVCLAVFLLFLLLYLPLSLSLALCCRC